jgi:hypothetical protein
MYGTPPTIREKSNVLARIQLRANTLQPYVHRSVMSHTKFGYNARTLTSYYFMGLHFILSFVEAYTVGWPRGLKWPAAARLPKLRVRTPPGAWMSVSFECCVLSGRGVCDGPITRSKVSYRVLCV